MKPLLRVALHNDYEVVVRGLRSMLEPYGGSIDVVEMDAQMPVKCNVDLTLYDTFGKAQVDGEDIDEVIENPQAGKVVIYTWNMHPVLVDQAIAKGCKGYIDKGMTGDELVDVLLRIADGEVFVSPPLALDDHEDPSSDTGDWPGQKAGLSAREAEVLALITQGYTNNNIASRSYLSINSVKSYIRSAYRKIGVERRSQAVRWGMENNMLPDRSRIIVH
ncbi:response regulator transcription factor [Tessaracoccus antarcticus]|uniref:response regulator transcription factor n=1 Tax=Tessaracoccus antarcticus TaxID=2479848 RepID=UPI001F2914BD|nr:response regulator transcription factor [Tessaracoccus antarcticus]